MECMDGRERNAGGGEEPRVAPSDAGAKRIHQRYQQHAKQQRGQPHSQRAGAGNARPYVFYGVVQRKGGGVIDAVVRQKVLQGGLAEVHEAAVLVPPRGFVLYAP